MLNRAMFGTKDAAQCFDLYCERTLEKLDLQQLSVQSRDISVLRHGDDFATFATRAQIAEFKEHLSKHLLVKYIATLGPRPQLLDVCEVRCLNRVRSPVDCATVWKKRQKLEADPRGVVDPKF